MNISDITNIREQVLAITERLDAMEAASVDTITPEAFEKKLLTVFKAGLFLGRQQQYGEIYDSVRYNCKWVEITAGQWSRSGDIDYCDLGMTEVLEENEMETRWGDVEVDMDLVDVALRKFKPEELDTETSES